ncbi:MAG: hypothetical protein JSS72_12910 [Armatimonadetes bacterium]|nr:hypothetical protein [Armatimonadota bacterium]
MNRFVHRQSDGWFDLPLCLTSGQSFRFEEVAHGHWVGMDGAYRYEFFIDGNQTEVQTNADEEAFRKLFCLQTDAAAVRASLTELAQEMTPYMSRMTGLRPMQPTDPVETFFSFLCAGNNNLPRIRQMVRKLSYFGPFAFEVNGTRFHRFPNLSELQAADEPRLRELGFGYRAKWIPAAVNRLGGQPNFFEDLRAQPYEEAHERLLEFEGVGHKLADCILTFCAHRHDVAPLDTHLWNAATTLYFPEWRGKAITDHRYLAVSQMLRSKFGDLCCWAQLFLYFGQRDQQRERSQK